MNNITATYSAEDNKIRLYSSERLDAETFERVKALGFKWAPRQELFVSPKWTPKREDLALELAGNIEPEESTIAERAEIKAERLTGLANKRAEDANRFAAMANQISSRFADGQPILKGHHSERKALKDKERMESASTKSANAFASVDYWNYRARSVAYHANRKNSPNVRLGRIKTLLKDLRSIQNELNHCNLALSLWEQYTTDDQIKRFVGAGQIVTGPICSTDEYFQLDKGEISPQDLREKKIAAYKRAINSQYWGRWLSHILNRLAFERDLLGAIPRHEGELRETAIQMFAREQGAFKPKATKTENGFSLESAAPLPAHLHDGKAMELTNDEWLSLMQDCGYSVPDKKRNAKPPLLNIDLQSVTVNRFGKAQERQIKKMTKAEHKHATRFGSGWVETSVCGTFRVRTMPNPDYTGPRYQAPMICVFLTDGKAHTVPESEAIKTHESV